MKEMDIENLLELYFEGRTTAEEEAALRHFFTAGDVPANLLVYKPLFDYFDNEIKQPKTVKSRKNQSIILWISGIAACAAILVGSVISMRATACDRAANYVMINGRCYTDEATIRAATIQSLQNVFEGNFLITDDKQSSVKEIIENQLKGFDFIINESQ